MAGLASRISGQMPGTVRSFLTGLPPGFLAVYCLVPSPRSGSIRLRFSPLSRIGHFAKIKVTCEGKREKESNRYKRSDIQEDTRDEYRRNVGEGDLGKTKKQRTVGACLNGGEPSDFPINISTN